MSSNEAYYYQDDNCKQLTDGYILNDYLTHGGYSFIYNISKKNDKTPLIAKFIPIIDEDSNIVDIEITSEDNFKQEVKITKLASENKISPLFIDSFILPFTIIGKRDIPNKQDIILSDKIKMGIIIMVKYDMSLLDYRTVYSGRWHYYKKEIIEQIFKLLQLLANINIKHVDLGNGNVVVNLSQDKKVRKGTIIDIKIIDFGGCKVDNDCNKIFTEMKDELIREADLYEDEL